MKKAAILADIETRRRQLDVLKVGDIHDEWQYDTDPGDSDRHGEAAVEAIRESGRRLNLNVPLDGESKKGKTWAETH